MDALRLRLVTDDSPEIRLTTYDDPQPWESRRWRDRQPLRFVPQHEHTATLRRAIARGRQALLAKQRPDGRFACPSVDDSVAYSQFVLLYAYLDRHDEESVTLATERLIDLQSDRGSWSRNTDDIDDLDATVLAYFALKLTGQRGNTPVMRAALQAIKQTGGVATCGANVRLWLALFGQIPFELCGIDSAGQTPLAQLVNNQPTKSIPIRRGVRELFEASPETWPIASCSTYDNHTEIEKSIFELLALTASDDSGQDVPQQCDARLARYMVDEPNALPNAKSHEDDEEPRLYLCSNVMDIFDTAAALTALKASGLLDTSLAVQQASRWLEAQLTADGTSDKARSIATAALQSNAAVNKDGLPPALELWSKDGPDRALETTATPADTNRLASAEVSADDLLAAQRPDGSWHALPEIIVTCSGSSATDTTAAGLAALSSSNHDDAEDAIAASVNWLLTHQELDGGWGDVTEAGTSRPRITANGILALLECDEGDESIAQPAIDFLLAQQLASGGWPDTKTEEDDDSDSLGAQETDIQTTGRCLEALACWVAGDEDKTASTKECASRPSLRIARLPSVS